jgi:N-acetylglucosamine-6-sulfatase
VPPEPVRLPLGTFKALQECQTGIPGEHAIRIKRYVMKYSFPTNKKLRVLLSLIVLTFFFIGLVYLYIATFAKKSVNSVNRRPNIVLILTDDQSIDSVKYMPYLSSQAYDQWTVFQNAFLNVPLCCPSRATIFTGLYSHHTGVTKNDGSVFKDDSTIATWLHNGGYKTGLFGKYLNGYPFPDRPSNYVPPGWDEWVAFSDDGRYYAPVFNEKGVIKSYPAEEEYYSTDLLARKAKEFIDSSSGPFFLLYSPSAPHEPSNPAKRHRGLYNNLPIEHSPNFNEQDIADKPNWVKKLPTLTQEQIITADLAQRRAITSLLAVDDGIKTIIDALIAKKVFDNTIIIFMTDNGYSWFSHRWGRKECEYEECIRTPLLIRFPWRPSRVETRLVQNIDIAPTVADLAGVSIPFKVDGVSLIPLLTNTATSWRKSLLLRSSSGPTRFWGVRTETWKYVELNTGEKELYDLVHDPYELQNVASQPQYLTIQSSLAAELTRLKSQ